MLEPRFAARFWDRVSKAPHPLGCWEWMRAVASTGYGVMNIGSERTVMRAAHRLAWELTHGPVPDGLFVCHTCDNKRCCNPDHLWLGTSAQNTADATTKGRMAKGEQRSLLRTEQVRDIRRRVSAGEVQRVVAEQYGICQQTVSDICRGKRWRHLEPA